MAGPKTFVGVSGKARQVKNIYVGVGGKARKVKRAYVGVGGKARLVYSSDWWVPSGVAAANCLAAYRFKGAASEAAALTDLTGHGYTLTKSGPPTWSSATGFTFNWNGNLNNASLNGQGVNTIVVRFANAADKTNLSAVGGSGNNRFLYRGLYLGSFYNGASGTAINTNNPALLYGQVWKDWERPPAGSFYVYTASTTVGTSGVLAFGGSSFYWNGTAMTTSSGQTGIDEGTKAMPSKYTLAYNAKLELVAAAFFSVELTAAQHKEVADGMNKF